MHQTMNQPGQQQAETPVGADASETQSNLTSSSGAVQAMQTIRNQFPFLRLAGELRNKVYEHDVAVGHSTIHLVRGIGAFRQSPLASLNRQVRREYLSIANDTCSPIEAVVRNLDFGQVIDYIQNLPEITRPKSDERSASEAARSPAQANGSSASSKTVPDTAAEFADPATKDAPTSGKTQWSEAALPRTVVIKLVFSKPKTTKTTKTTTTAARRKARAPALLTLLPQPRSAQSKRWSSRLFQWKDFVTTDPKTAKLNFEYEAKTRMPFEMVNLKIFGTSGWGEGRAGEECKKLDKAFESALGRDTSGFYQIAPMIEASDEEDEVEEDGEFKEISPGGPGPDSWW